ncbi:MAG: immune inhibitor A [Chloroflexi bacterium]|nr:immune inhibitor A [Chloroflexota bacterium]
MKILHWNTPTALTQRFVALGLVVAIVTGIATLQSPAQAEDGGKYPTEQALAEAVVPPRDRLDLAQRLKGVGEIAPPPTTPARVYQIGDVEKFSAQNDDTGVFTIDATLVYMNDVAYMWVENGYTVDYNSLKNAADEFANDVYQQEHEVFGSEWSPGIDGDVRLHILHVSNLGDSVAAYYYSEQEIPNEAISSSNEREMFYVNLDTMLPYIGSKYYVGVLAHEFQHMIHWVNDANETSWMNEGLSELAAFITGFGPSDFTSSFLERPGTQLTYWPEDDRGILYGASFLFNAYLLERFGIDFIKTMVADDANGMQSVQNTLEALGITDPMTGQPITAEQVFAEWTVANYLNDASVGDGRYAYTHPELADLVTITGGIEKIGLPTTLASESVNQWGTNYYTLKGGPDTQNVTLQFSGNDTVQLLPANAHDGQFAMWSNQVDDSDARLTRQVDLTGVSSATLNFWAWYNIEELWDFSYVMVSADGGVTWTPLETDRTTSENPFNTGYGAGYTAASGDWVQESIDLSAYAGQKILLRFEYITDDAVVKNGFLLDDVSIPEIGFSENFEQPLDPSWQVEGWARIDNVLPQAFTLQLIQEKADGTLTVEPLLTAEDATTGEWTLPLGGDVKSWTLVVSGLAPATIIPATFNLDISVQ